MQNATMDYRDDLMRTVKNGQNFQFQPHDSEKENMMVESNIPNIEKSSNDAKVINTWQVMGETFEIDANYQVIDYLGAGAYGVVCAGMRTYMLFIYIICMVI